MRFEVTILGCGSATPTLIRSASAQYINVQERHFLIDCGEGTQIQLRKFKTKFQKINHIYISHLHGDHFFGLIGFLSSLHLLGRTKEMTIYAPPPLKDLIFKSLEASQTYLCFKLKFIDLTFDTPTILFEDNLVKVSSFPMKHRIECCGFRVEEKERERTMKKEKLAEYKISVADIPSIKKGSDLTLDDGSIIPNSELTLAPRPPLSYAYCSDTAYSEKVIEAVSGVDVLYHEATFLEHLAKRAKETFHSTAKQAATVASKANVKQLVVGHFSARYHDLKEFEEEIAPIFPNFVLAEDGMLIDLTAAK